MLFLMGQLNRRKTLWIVVVHHVADPKQLQKQNSSKFGRHDMFKPNTTKYYQNFTIKKIVV